MTRMDDNGCTGCVGGGMNLVWGTCQFGLAGIIILGIVLADGNLETGSGGDERPWPGSSGRAMGHRSGSLLLPAAPAWQLPRPRTRSA